MLGAGWFYLCHADSTKCDVPRFILFTKFPGDSCAWCLTSALLSLSILGTATRGFSGRSSLLPICGVNVIRWLPHIVCQ